MVEVNNAHQLPRGTKKTHKRNNLIRIPELDVKRRVALHLKGTYVPESSWVDEAKHPRAGKLALWRVRACVGIS